MSLVFVGSLVGSVAICGDAWQTYRASDGSFTVSFPGKPTSQQGFREFKGYKFPTETAAYGKGARGYVVMRLNIAAVSPEAKSQDENLMKYGLSTFTESRGYQVYSRDTFRMDGHPGRHVVVSKNGLEQQVYLVAKDGQVFTIMVGCRGGTSVDEAANKFIASFRLSP